MKDETLSEPALFRSSRDAVTFAFNCTLSTKPGVLARLIPPPPPAGRGLGGLDGATQAGFIKCEIAALMPRIKGHIVTARFAVRGVPCSCHRACCSGSVPNPEWLRAIGEISDAVRTEALAGMVVNYTLRRIIVRRYFGEHSSLKDAAKASGVDRDMASRHASLVIAYLKEQERVGWYDLDARLKAAYIVE